jgi:FKBP-type peptidyl-prolyl cis-trans isomerase
MAGDAGEHGAARRHAAIRAGQVAAIPRRRYPSAQRRASRPARESMHMTDLVIGTGAEATPGQDISVHYTGWLFEEGAPENKGRKFDSSRDRGKPFVFTLGIGQVIAGWDAGFAGMKVGGQRRLIVPPEMGYGARGAGGVIPPNATLVFDVELLGVG